jgi:hypothetical protein
MDVAGPAGRVTFPVKSACCLMYRTIPASAGIAARYCTGCPILPDETRPPRWQAYLATR